MGTLLTIMGLAIGLQMNDSLMLTIKEDTLFTEVGNSEIKFSVKLKNGSSQKHLAYNLNLYNEGFDLDSYYCDGKGSAGNYIFVYDSNGKQQYITIFLDKSIYDDPVTLDDVEAIYYESKRLLIESREVVSSESIIEKAIIFNLKKFNLEPGVYDLYIIYSSGSFLFDLLGKSIIEKHQKEFNAQLFQGCIKSNIIKLIVQDESLNKN